MGVRHQDTMRFIGACLAIILLHTAQSGPTYNCGKNSHKVVRVSAGQTYLFKATRDTRRCVVLYKVTPSCSEMKLFCGSFFLPNKDDFRCRRGDKMLVKAMGTKPAVYCNSRKPRKNFPVLSERGIKIWTDIRPSKMYPSKGFTCVVQCND